MANYPAPTEVDMIFDATKFYTLPQKTGNAQFISQQIIAANELLADCNDIINNTNIGYVPQSFFPNLGFIPSNSVYSIAFTDFVPTGAIYFDFNIGLMSGGYNNATGVTTYGFDCSKCTWSFGTENSINSTTNYTGMFPYLPVGTTATLCNPAFMNQHITGVINMNGNTTIYLLLSINTVNAGTGNPQAGTYGINSPGSINGNFSPYTRQQNKGCKFFLFQ